MAIAVLAEKEFGPDHEYDVPPEAVRVTEVVEQVIFAEPETDGVGTVMSCVTTVVSVSVQPFSAVTVTV